MKINNMQNDIDKINLKNGMIDSHFHLFHMKTVGMNYIDIIKYCLENNLEAAVDIGINADNFEERIKTAAELPGIYTAHGFYPSECIADDLEEKTAFLEECLVKDKKAVALGEIGYDFFHDYGSEELQTRLFQRQITIADKLKLPIIVHSRDAEKQTLNILSSENPSSGGIIHCFSYSAQTAHKFIDMGFYISFAGNVTYKNSELIQQAAREVPLNRILIETDAPYLSPRKVRNKKNHPGYIGYTYDTVAELKNISTEELIFSVNENFKKVFKI